MCKVRCWRLLLGNEMPIADRGTFPGGRHARVPDRSRQREFLIDNLLARIHLATEMIPLHSNALNHRDDLTVAPFQEDDMSRGAVSSVNSRTFFRAHATSRGLSRPWGTPRGHRRPPDYRKSFRSFRLFRPQG
jgi:hypothetical protein